MQEIQNEMIRFSRKYRYLKSDFRIKWASIDNPLLKRKWIFQIDYTLLAQLVITKFKLHKVKAEPIKSKPIPSNCKSTKLTKTLIYQVQLKI